MQPSAVENRPTAPATPLRNPGRRAFGWLLALAIAGALVYFACRGVHWAEVLRTISGARWQPLTAAAAIATGTYFLRAVRWRILLNAEGRCGIATVFWANMAGYLGNNVLPARGGELLRTVLISRQSELSKMYVLTTALSERLMDVIAVVLASSLVLLGIEPKPRWMADASRGGAVAAVAAVLAVALLPRAERLLRRIVERLPLAAGLRRRVLPLLDQGLLGLKAFHDRGRLAGFAALTAIVWLGDAVVATQVGRSLGLAISFPVALLLLSGLALGSALPSTPGYVGIYQFAAVTILTPFGISRDGALAYILLSQAVGYSIVLLFGLPGFSALRRGRAMDGSPAIPR